MSDEMKVTEQVKDAFNEAVSQGKSPDEVKVAMLTAGAPFAGINKIYNDLMIEAGLMANPTEKKEVVDAACSTHDISTEEGFNAAVNEIAEKLTGINARSAEASVRGYARRNEIPVYKKQRQASGGTGSGRFNSKFFDWLRNHPNATEDEVMELLTTYGTKNVARHKSYYMNLVKLANDIVNGVTVEEPEFAEPAEGNTFADFQIESETSDEE